MQSSPEVYVPGLQKQVGGWILEFIQVRQFLADPLQVIQYLVLHYSQFNYPPSKNPYGQVVHCGVPCLLPAHL